MADWENPFEQRLAEAFEAGETAVCLGMLRHTELGLPAERPGPPYPWPTVTGPDRTWLIAYTSQEAMRAATGGAVEHARITTLAELAAGWPDPRWGLAVNPGLPVSFFMESGTVARLAVPSLAQDHLAEPQPELPVLQKLLTVEDLYSYLADGETTVSGYCHHALDVEYIATPTVLLEALNRSAEEGLLSAEGSVHVLRWHAFGFNLYPTPYGGVDEESMRAVQGWVIEEPPFVGLGLAPNPDRLIREYKVHGVRLPHGAEIVELTDAGTEVRRAIFDGDTGRWLLVHRAGAS
ncbi:SseB family protein [Thermostaphylospora chromogena]|uniref:SseB protein N-terminal domain-containing protein n=1 Tax=Thermostaphylospora chromogena TaxID=35622 RepID=A0A1H1ASN8_9ACTN|nr:SseB family protein [Thermostaphylospora chromogena]SDQ42632.1 SseB protein N-terminal domain-containing protein [Thermostaphylospora chromogena]